MLPWSGRVSLNPFEMVLTHLRVYFGPIFPIFLDLIYRIGWAKSGIKEVLGLIGWASALEIKRPNPSLTILLYSEATPHEVECRFTWNGRSIQQWRLSDAWLLTERALPSSSRAVVHLFTWTSLRFREENSEASAERRGYERWFEPDGSADRVWWELRWIMKEISGFEQVSIWLLM